MLFQKSGVLFITALLIAVTTNFTSFPTPLVHASSSASSEYYRGADGKMHRYVKKPSYFKRHPYVKSGLVGAGVGAGAGLILGHGKGGVIKGAALGTGVGLGYQYLKKH